MPPEAKESVSLGRLKITQEIKQNAQHALAQDGQGQATGRGIELVDVGLSRIEFVPQVREAAFDRAISLMEAIAVKTTSEGEQRKKEIINKTQAEVQKIEGEGKQAANILKGASTPRSLTPTPRPFVKRVSSTTSPALLRSTRKHSRETHGWS